MQIAVLRDIFTEWAPEGYIRMCRRGLKVKPVDGLSRAIDRGVQMA